MTVAGARLGELGTSPWVELAPLRLSLLYPWRLVSSRVVRPTPAENDIVNLHVQPLEGACFDVTEGGCQPPTVTSEHAPSISVRGGFSLREKLSNIDTIATCFFK